MNPEVQQPLQVGQILGQVIKVLSDNFLQFYLVGLAVGIPSLIVVALLPPDDSTIVSSLVDSIFSQFATGALTYGSYLYLRGQRASASTCLAYAAQNFGRLFGLSLLTGIIIGLGMMLFVVPGLILATMFAVAVPAMLAERIPVTESMSRSSRLTKGYRWQVFGLMLLTIGGLLVGSLALGAIIGLADLMYDGFGLDDILIWLWIGLYYAVAAVVAATLYYRLREVKEGLGIDQVAAIFD
jgi:hypothetical protein